MRFIIISNANHYLKTLTDFAYTAVRDLFVLTKRYCSKRKYDFKSRR